MNSANKPRRPELGLLTILVAIADAGSVSGAARRLAMSQPAVSHALRRLRDLVGDPLFERAGSRLSATPQAEAMLATAREVVEKGSGLLVPSAFDPATASYGWRIGVSDYALNAVGPALVSRVRAISPRLSVDFLPVGAATLDDMLAQRIDFAFWGDLGDPRIAPPITVTQLFRERYIGVMSATHPLAHRARTGDLSLDEWLGFEHIRFTSLTPGISSVDRALVDLGHTRRIALTSPSHSWNVRSLVGTTHLLCLPARLAHLAASEAFVTFPIPVSLPSYPYFLLCHARVTSNPALRFMRDLIRDICRSYAGNWVTGFERSAYRGGC